MCNQSKFRFERDITMNLFHFEIVAKYIFRKQTYENYAFPRAICPKFSHFGSQFGEILDENITTVVCRNSFILSGSSIFGESEPRAIDIPLKGSSNSGSCKSSLMFSSVPRLVRNRCNLLATHCKNN